MKTYKAVIIEKDSGLAGSIIANTKSPGKYKGMSFEQFIEATKYISCFEIAIEEI